jgi:hypothetical protein
MPGKRILPLEFSNFSGRQKRHSFTAQNQNCPQKRHSFTAQNQIFSPENTCPAVFALFQRCHLDAGQFPQVNCPRTIPPRQFPLDDSPRGQLPPDNSPQTITPQTTSITQDDANDDDDQTRRTTLFRI